MHWCISFSKSFTLIFSSFWALIGVFKNFAMLTGKHLYWSLFLIKLQAWKHAPLLKRDSNTGVFLWILQNLEEQLFYRLPPVAAFEITSIFLIVHFLHIFEYQVIFIFKLEMRYCQANYYKETLLSMQVHDLIYGISFCKNNWILRRKSRFAISKVCYVICYVRSSIPQHVIVRFTSSLWNCKNFVMLKVRHNKNFF